MKANISLFTKDYQRIQYDHYAYGHDKVIIIAHGFFNSKESLLLKELAQALKDQYDSIVIDFRGHGKSNGLFCWTAREYLDLEAVMTYARKFYKRVGVIGFSLGAATSLIAASKSDLMDSVIAVSAPTEFQKIEFHLWEMSMDTDIAYNFTQGGFIGKGVRPGPFWLRKDKPIDIVSQIQCPVFYLHGENDWLIKPWHSKALYDQTQADKRLAIIKNGPHAEYLIRNNKEESIGLIKEWFAQTLKKKSDAIKQNRFVAQEHAGINFFQ